MGNQARLLREPIAFLIIKMLLTFLTFLVCVSGLQRTGIYNHFYQVPYSIGERTREWDSRQVILDD